MNGRQLLTMAASTVLLSAALTSAQTMVDRSGANDANNKIGSNGRNTVLNRPNPWDVANAIVDGHVTGGKQFRGNVQSTDPFAFRGNTGSRVQDNFIRDSSSVTTGGVTSYNASQTKSYYGDSRAVPPPAGYVSVPGSGGYTPPSPQQWQSYDPRIQSLNPQLPSEQINSGLSTPGIADFAQTSGGLTVTPALQPPQLNPSALSDYTNLNQNNLSSPLTNEQLTRLRQELGQTNNPQQGVGAPLPTNQQTGLPLPNGQMPGNAQQQSQQPGGQQPGTQQPGALDNSINAAQPMAGQLNDQVKTATPMSGAVNNGIQPQATPEPGLVTKLAGVQTPASPQNSDQTNTDLRPGQAAEQSASVYNAQLRAKKAAEEKAKNADQPGALPGKTKTGQAPDKTSMDTHVAPQSVQTLAGSTKAKGLSDLLTKAEGQMREGKFASAIDTYDAAESVDPRNPMIKLGRANAELGGAYYRRAEATLRQLPANDRRVLAGRYDLRAFIGDDRLQMAQKDLSDLIEKSPNDTGAAVLLAYIYYNTGNERRATALLDLADKRAGGKDSLVTFLKNSWGSPTDSK